MTKDVLLSIITICFNNKEEIERTCESISKQTFQDFEWIVIDGGSTDGTLDILNKYKDRINVLISEPDKGRYNAMNKGILKAQGYWLNFMNGGDTFHSDNVLAGILSELQNQNNYILFGNMNFIRNNTEGQIVIYNEQEVNISDYFYDRCINHQSSFIPRALFLKYGLYNEEYDIVSDWEKWIVFSLLGCKFKHINRTIADFYDGGIGSSVSEKHLREKELVRKTYPIQLFERNQQTKYYFLGIPLLKSVFHQGQRKKVFKLKLLNIPIIKIIRR